MGDLIYGIQPILNALIYKRRILKKLFLKSSPNFSLRVKKIMDIAENIKIPITYVSNQKLLQMCSNSNHQGVVLSCGPLLYSSLKDFPQIFNEKYSIIVALDQIEDPQNLGAILRTCGFYGVGAVIVPRNHTSPLSAVVSKVSAGVSEWLPIISVPNLTRFLNEQKSKGFWVAGLEEKAKKSLSYLKRDRPLIIVFGNEGRGIRNLVKKNCDNLYRIPGNSEISSLNVSNAAAIVLFHLSKFPKI